MFSNYLYTSSTSKVFRDHFVNAAKKYVKEFKLNSKKSYIMLCIDLSRTTERPTF